MFELNSNPVVLKYTGDEIINSVEEAKNIMINKVFKDYKIHGYGRLAVIYKPDNKLIGFTGFKYLPEIDLPDLGYRFIPEYWGKGIATESSQMVLHYGFNELELQTILGFTEVKNIASSSVLKKLGFRFNKMAPYPGEEDKEAIEWYILTKKDYERQ
jgi:RimJ/RimL family protein N-acetyltransferase